jgi:hypothetical protein
MSKITRVGVDLLWLICMAVLLDGSTCLGARHLQPGVGFGVFFRIRGSIRPGRWPTHRQRQTHEGLWGCHLGGVQHA